MHGLVFRAVERFLEDVYGPALRRRVLAAVGFGENGAEAMSVYPETRFDRLLTTAAAELSKPVEDLLEDIGIYLVSHDHRSAPRRLLRFGGVTFVDFLLSLDELPERTRLAVPDLYLPALCVDREDAKTFRVFIVDKTGRAARLLTGVLRALADDYGALTVIRSASNGSDLVVTVHEACFADERPFALARASGA